MVQVMYAGPYGGSAGPNESSGTGPTTLVHIHSIERHVAGNGIKLVVYGEMKIAAGQYVYAKDLKLGTVQQLLLTPELNLNNSSRLHGSEIYLSQGRIRQLRFNRHLQTMLQHSKLLATDQLTVLFGLTSKQSVKISHLGPQIQE